MSSTHLTGRERIDRMLKRQDHDRVPRFDTYWPQTIRRWQGEGLGGDEQAALELLGCDLRPLGPTYDPAPFPGRCELIEEDNHTRVTRDAWGATLRRWKTRAGVPAHIGFECDSPEVWRQRYRPALQNGGIQIDLDAISEVYAIALKQCRWTCLRGHEPFHMMRMMLGDEMELLAMAERPEWIREISTVFTDALLRNFDAVLSEGIVPDAAWIYGDMAYNHGTFCSPATYRELIWPDHKRLADWAHAHGMKIFYHTDGNVNAVVDLYVQAGFDCLHPLEAKAGMDVRTLVPSFGKQLAFFGNIDAVALVTNDPDRIEQEVSLKLNAGKAGRCYMYHSDHSVPSQVSLQTYRFIAKLLDRYGRYD